MGEWGVGATVVGRIVFLFSSVASDVLGTRHLGSEVTSAPWSREDTSGGVTVGPRGSDP